jgi:hypothetical protein
VNDTILPFQSRENYTEIHTTTTAHPPTHSLTHTHTQNMHTHTHTHTHTNTHTLPHKHTPTHMSIPLFYELVCCCTVWGQSSCTLYCFRKWGCWFPHSLWGDLLLLCIPPEFFSSCLCTYQTRFYFLHYCQRWVLAPPLLWAVLYPRLFQDPFLCLGRLPCNGACC